jgi:hypothetical protein
MSDTTEGRPRIVVGIDGCDPSKKALALGRADCCC